MWLWWLVRLHPKEVGSIDSSGPYSTPNSNVCVIKGRWWSLWGFAADQYWKFRLLTVRCKLKCSLSLFRRLFGRPGFSVSILWNWWKNCKSLSRSLKECTICNLHEWRFRSLCRIRHTLLSHVPNAWACIHADHLGLSQRTPTLRPCSNCGRLTRWLFTCDRAFFTPLPYQSVDSIWRWGNRLIQFTAKSMLNLCNGPYPNKEFHCTNSFSNAPTLHVN
jgi:hypothetical protein